MRRSARRSEGEPDGRNGLLSEVQVWDRARMRDFFFSRGVFQIWTLWDSWFWEAGESGSAYTRRCIVWVLFEKRSDFHDSGIFLGERLKQSLIERYAEAMRILYSTGNYLWNR